MAIVNLEEMAEILRISRPTMREWLRRHDDFPVLQRGGNGVPWQFDAEAVVAFVHAKRAEAAAGRAARDADLDQIALPWEEEEGAPDPVASWKDREARARTLAREDELAKARGFLIQKTELRGELTAAFAMLGKTLQAMPAVLGRRYNLPDAVVRDMRAQVAQAQRDAWAELDRYLEGAPVPEAAEEAGDGRLL